MVFHQHHIWVFEFWTFAETLLFFLHNKLASIAQFLTGLYNLCDFFPFIAIFMHV